MKFQLTESHRNTSDEDLIKDLADTASKLNVNSITQEQYAKYGKYHPSTIQRRFDGWINACHRAGLQTTMAQEQYLGKITCDDIISDMQKVARALHNSNYLTGEEYTAYGKYNRSTASRKFGSWNKALIKAGLEITEHRNISDVELFEDIERMWILLGRQPTTNDVKAGVSKYSLNSFARRYGSWRKALEAFVDFVNSEQETQEKSLTPEITIPTKQAPNMQHKTPRDINLRLRFLVLSRDNFSCCICGASPAKDGGITQLHVDHIKPWSKGGETVLENLQTLCSKCNLGKSDL